MNPLFVTVNCSRFGGSGVQMYRMAKSLPNVVGAVVGERNLSKCRRRASRWGLNLDEESSTWRIGASRIVGPSSFPGSWISRAGVAVMSSSSYEGIPGALREAMLLGTPVITTNVGYVSELVRDGWNGLVVKRDDADGLATAIDRVLQAAPTSRECADAGRSLLDCSSISASEPLRI